MKYSFDKNFEFAKQLDVQDPLCSLRDRFYLRKGHIYMDGNSLGLCSKDAEDEILKILGVWKKEGIDIWSVENSRYFYYPALVGALMADLIGAEHDEVTTTNSTTINIHQSLSSFYYPTEKKYKILIDNLNFPTDRYAVESHLRTRGYSIDDALKVVESKDGRTISEDEIIDAMTDDVALALFPSVLYRSSQLLDMQKVTDAAKNKGIVIGWDLCHSIGLVPHDFKKLDADFAVWCTYKYLSGGPGSIAGLYINRKHFKDEPGMAGWHGNVKETQFQLAQKFEHSLDADGWLTGTAPLLSMAGLMGVLQIYKEVGMKSVREKSLKITAYLMYLVDEKLKAYGYGVGTPRENDKRGGHVSLEHSEAYRICQALKKHKVIPDFREPNVIRLAPISLYTSYEDVYNLVSILEEITIYKEYEKFSNTRALIV